jgi:hypothetical protein
MAGQAHPDVLAAGVGVLGQQVQRGDQEARGTEAALQAVAVGEGLL